MIVWAVRSGVKYVPEFPKRYLFSLSGKYSLQICPSAIEVTLSSDTNMTVAIHTWTHSFGIVSLAVNLSAGQKFAASDIRGTVNGFLTEPDLCLCFQCVRCPKRIHLCGKG
jgi:hypothetical protein